MRHTSRNRARLLLTVLSGGGGAALTLTATTTSASETITLRETSSTSAFKIAWGDGTVDDIVANDTGTQTNTYASADVYKIRLLGAGAYDMRELDLRDSALSGDMSDVLTLTHLTRLILIGDSFTGDMSSVSSLASTTNLQLSGNSFTGDMSSVSSMTPLTTLLLDGNSFTGDMSSVSALTSLTFLQLVGSDMTYTTPNVGGITGLTTYVVQMALSQSGVDAIINDVYADRDTFTNALTINIAGTNAAPSSAAITKINTLTAAPYEWTIVYTAP